MSRIGELQKKYPTVPIDVIAKLDLLNQGVKDSPELDKVSVWTKPKGSYQSYDHDLTFKDLQEKTPWRIKDGQVLTPGAIYFNTGNGCRIMRDSRSSYTIREVSEGKFALFEGEEQVNLDMYFPRPKTQPKVEAVTSKGTPVSDLVESNRRCFRIHPVRYCQYFDKGEECKFCNFNPSHDDLRSVGLTRRTTINLDETVEAFKILGSEVRLVEGYFEAGGFATADREGKVYVNFMERLASAGSYKPGFRLLGEAMNRKDYQRLKDAGLDNVNLNIEVWDERLFREVAPGKAKHLPREGWLEAFHDAVEIFGPGHVGGNFAAGVTLLAENGFTTWQEARDSHIEGNTWLIKNDVMPIFTTLRWAEGSPFSKNPANRDKFPPTEFYLDLAVAHHAAMNEYGLYEKLDRFLYCALCCGMNPYIGDIGFLEKAGDFGTWMSDCVPYELNWLAQFVDSIKSPASGKSGN